MLIKSNRDVSVLQTEIWVSTYSRCLAAGQVKPDLQEGGTKDLSNGDHSARLPQYQVGDSRFVFPRTSLHQNQTRYLQAQRTSQQGEATESTSQIRNFYLTLMVISTIDS